MQLKVLKVGVGVSLNSIERGRLRAAAELANRIGQLPCDQAGKAGAASEAMDALIEAFEPAETPTE